MKNNSIQTLSVFLQVLISILFLLLLVLVASLFIIPYPDLLDLMVQTAGIEDKKEVFQSRIFPEEKLLWIRIAGVAALLIFSILAYKIFFKAKRLAQKLINFGYLTRSVIISGVRTFNELRLFEKSLFILFFLVLILYRFKNLLIYPFTNDELYTWLNFVHPGFVAAITYYPAPNNHILYSICSNVVDVFTDNTRLVLRLPAFLAGIISVKILFLYVVKRFSFYTGILASLFYASFTNIFYYSIHGRGYVFVFLFFILLLISVLEILNEKNVLFWKLIFILSAVFGFYSIPVFLYPFLSLFVFAIGILLFQKKYDLLKGIVSWSGVAGGITLLLYFPILLISGWNAVTGNSFVTSLRSQVFFSGFPDYLTSVAHYLWDSEYGIWFTILLLVISTLQLSLTKRKYLIYLSLSCLVVPLMILLIQQVHPFFRIWDYLLILFAILAAFSIESILIRIKSLQVKRGILIMVFFTCGFYLHYKIHSFVSRGFPYYASLKASLEKALTYDIKSAYVGEETYFLYLRYYSLERKREIKVEAERLNLAPDLVIIPENKAFPYSDSQYTLLENNGFARIWLKKDQ